MNVSNWVTVALLGAMSLITRGGAKHKEKEIFEFATLMPFQNDITGYKSQIIYITKRTKIYLLSPVDQVTVYRK